MELRFQLNNSRNHWFSWNFADIFYNFLRSLLDDAVQRNNFPSYLQFFAHLLHNESAKVALNIPFYPFDTASFIDFAPKRAFFALSILIPRDSELLVNKNRSHHECFIPKRGLLVWDAHFPLSFCAFEFVIAMRFCVPADAAVFQRFSDGREGDFEGKLEFQYNLVLLESRSLLHLHFFGIRQIRQLTTVGVRFGVSFDVLLIASE